MAPASTPPLPQFLRFLSAQPDPAAIAAALANGPLMDLEPSGVMVWAGAGDGRLNALGHDRLPARSAAVWREVPLDVDLPVVRAYRASEVLIHDLGTLTDTFPALTLDGPGWLAIHPGNTRGILVSAPIVSRGVSIGAYSFAVPDRSGLTTLEIATLDGVSAALGLWLSATGADRARERPSHETVAPIALTARQAHIALLIEQGRTNAAIAAALGFSEATVKADVRQLMRNMRAMTRLEAAQRARALGLLPPTA